MSAVNAPHPQYPEPKPDPRTAEPSMDDILASIRRIIADDQSRNAGGSSMSSFRRPAGPPPASSGAPPVQTESRYDRPIETADAKPAADAPAATTWDLEPSTLVSAPEATEAMRETESVAPPETGKQPHLNPPAVALEDDAHRSSMIEEIASMGVASILGPRPVEASSEPPPNVVVPAAEPSAALEAATGPENPPPVEVDLWSAGQEEDEPIMSAETGASIGSSFQALATTVFVQNTETVERMMRELLRPMLKTWLDENLPGIVERLVRAEIERVARGGSR